ncbi:hypothetical protein EVAR_50608_1 [Eumeta japonica]|uniref:Uncharacterized protein n=1 Tax=Eumeta variegata TaxID=151549 RepID=A0A4C1Y6M1_EUMVA|nr:hypothetical protein EVAR_50608_1 [Eumeta japonica]
MPHLPCAVGASLGGAAGRGPRRAGRLRFAVHALSMRAPRASAPECGPNAADQIINKRSSFTLCWGLHSRPALATPTPDLDVLRRFLGPHVR